MTEQGQNGVGGSGKAKGDDVPRVELLDDKPTNEDKTGDGHQRVADAIARLIERESGGKAIALEGSWGSGKSSVIEMLGGSFDALSEEARKHNEKLAEESYGAVDPEKILPTDYMVYVFDAWKHEGDPLRMAFLQGLVQRLSLTREGNRTEPWLDEDARTTKEEKLKELQGSQSTTQIIESLVLRTKDTIAVSALLAAPICLAIGIAYISADAPGFWLTLFGCLGLMLPIVVALTPLVELWRTPEAKERIAHILLTRQPKKQTLQVQDKHEVTSINFEKGFKKLLEGLLDDCPQRRLIVVIDNLDRLSSEEALRVWTTMRVFLEMERKRTPWLDRFWLIVPYDRTALTEIWDGDAAADNGATTSATATQGKPDEGKPKSIRHSRPASFLDKTFAVRFDVPPLLLAQWEQALGRYLRQAFGKDLPDQVIKEVARLSRRFAFDQQHPPTPRHLKLFVNDIGALARQHWPRLAPHADTADKDLVVFALADLAGYAVLRRVPLTPEEIREDLRDKRKEINSRLPVGWMTDERARALACLVFNTWKPKEAMELLLTSPLEAALVAGNQEPISTLLSTPAAPSVIADWLEDSAEALNGTSADALLASLTALHELGTSPSTAIADEPSHLHPTTQRLAARLIRGSDQWPDTSQLPALCTQITVMFQAGPVLQATASRLNKIDLTQDLGVSAEDLAEAWCTLWCDAGHEGEDAVRNVRVPVPTDRKLARAFLSTLWEASPDSAGMWDWLEEPTSGGVFEVLTDNVNTKGEWDAIANCLRILWASDGLSSDWSKAASTLGHVLQTTPIGQWDDLVAVLRFLRGLDLADFDELDSGHEQKKQALEAFKEARKTFVTGGHCYERFTQAMESENAAQAAELLIEIGLHGSLVPKQSSGPAFDNARALLEQIRDGSDAHHPVIDAIQDVWPSVLQEFIQTRLEQADAPLLLGKLFSSMSEGQLASVTDPLWLIKHWQLVERAEQKSSGIIRTLLSAHESETVTQPRAFSHHIVEQGIHEERIPIVIALLRLGTLEHKLEAAVAQRLQKLDKESWHADIAAHGPWCRLLMAMVDRHNVSLNPAFYQGVNLAAKRLVDEPANVKNLGQETASQLLKAVSESDMFALRRLLRETARGADTSDQPLLYEAFGEEIAEAMLSDPEPTDVPKILTPAIDGTHEKEPRWVTNFLVDTRAAAVVDAAEPKYRPNLFSAARANIQRKVPNAEQYKLFLSKCRIAGLAIDEEPSGSNDSPPA